MTRLFFKAIKVFAVIYFIVCALLYFFQEKLIFFPQKLDKSYQYRFDQKFEEKNIKTEDGTVLNGILFKADSAKGLIFYLHGNAGSLAAWGGVAKTYTDLNYDLFMLDYRGYGKSEGEIGSQAELFNDLQTVYNELKKNYPENKIVVLGYSIGTGPAAKLASDNKPRLLILQAPYYSLSDMMQHSYPIIPTFILKYKFETNTYLKKCQMPLVLFHGRQDEVIYYGSSLKLKEQFKQHDTLITLEAQGHNGMTDNESYKAALRAVLVREY